MPRLPFSTVMSQDTANTHLVVSSPALPGTRPDKLPVSTLCGLPTIVAVDTPVHSVSCLRCLNRSPQYMHLPAWEGQPRAAHHRGEPR